MYFVNFHDVYLTTSLFEIISDDLSPRLKGHCNDFGLLTGKLVSKTSLVALIQTQISKLGTPNISGCLTAELFLEIPFQISRFKIAGTSKATNLNISCQDKDIQSK